MRQTFGYLIFKRAEHFGTAQMKCVLFLLLNSMRELTHKGCKCLIYSDKPNNPRVFNLRGTRFISHPLWE